jgi:hypothetical protein
VLFEENFGDWYCEHALAFNSFTLKEINLLGGTGDLIKLGLVSQDTFLIMSLTLSGMFIESKTMIVTASSPMITFRKRFVLRNERLNA